jgi:hypothetical protein
MEQYSGRLDQRVHALARRDRMDRRLETARLALAALGLGLVWTGAIGRTSPVWLIVPVGVFAALVFYHQRVRRLRALARRAVAFYRAGLDRLQGTGRGAGPTGDRFSVAHHIYGADLDLFGSDGLYPQLCTARTPMGEETLARWLLAPADLDTIHERHVGIRDLCGRLDLREDLAILGEPARLDLDAERLAAWAEAPDRLTRPGLRCGAWCLTGAAVVTAGVWALWGLASPFLAVLAVQAALLYVLRGRIQAAVAGVEDAYEELTLLSSLLRRIEAESFAAAPLKALAAQLTSASLTASASLASLATIVNFVEARRNPLLVPVLLPVLYVLHSALAAERWRRRHGRGVTAWLGVLGNIEALQSISAYSFERPADPFPEFVTGPAAFIASGLGHPLIAAPARVYNDVDLSGEIRVLLVSGSNMSGKSTLLRSVGINTVLAMAGAPVCAGRLRLTPLAVGASIRVNDSLHEGSSRFYAEITRLRQLFEPSALPLLFLLDELLQGTNSHDRRIGAQGILRGMIGRGAIGLVSTHDLALAHEVDLPPGALRNVHFQDELVDGVLKFDFKLREGLVTKSNGVELMRAIGLEV